MKKKTKIIIIAVVAVALVALAVWYFGFHKKKAKELESESEKTDNISVSGGVPGGSSIRLASTPETVVDVIHRTDYEVAPAAAYRLNHDQLTELDAQLGRTSNAIVNTNKINR